MPSSIKWSKDTSPTARKRVGQIQQLSLDEAKLAMRLHALNDIAAFVKQEYGKTRQATTCETMLVTIEMFRWFAVQGACILRALREGQPADTLLSGFVQGCGRFGGRGGDPLMSCRALFLDAPDLLLMYLQRGAIDLTTCWYACSPGDRYAFVRAVLDIDKSYPNTIGASESLLFDEAKSAIQRWKPGHALTMQDVLERWCQLESNDSIYTGMAFNSGHRRTNGEQLADYARLAGTPQGYHFCWSAIVNAVRLAKNIAPNDDGAIIALFEQNVPAIISAFRPNVSESVVRGFVETGLRALLKNPEPPPLQQAITSGAALRLKTSDLNKLKELEMMKIVQLTRAKTANERNPLIESIFKGKVFTRRINDERVAFDSYDELTEEFVFQPA